MSAFCRYVLRDRILKVWEVLVEEAVKKVSCYCTAPGREEGPVYIPQGSLWG